MTEKEPTNESKPKGESPQEIAERLIEKERELNSQRQSPAPPERPPKTHFWNKSLAVAAIALGSGAVLGAATNALEAPLEVVALQYETTIAEEAQSSVRLPLEALNVTVVDIIE